MTRAAHAARRAFRNSATRSRPAWKPNAVNRHNSVEVPARFLARDRSSQLPQHGGESDAKYESTWPTATPEWRRTPLLRALWGRTVRAG